MAQEVAMPTTKKTAREVAEEFENGRVIERPDGFYWQDKEGRGEYGPFRTRREAMEDMEFGAETEGGDASLQEAESEIGIADWIDPDTGEPAEESIPHIEDN
jgi:hypothetical protein